MKVPSYESSHPNMRWSCNILLEGRKAEIYVDVISEDLCMSLFSLCQVIRIRRQAYNASTLFMYAKCAIPARRMQQKISKDRADDDGQIKLIESHGS